jgi:hypothetical protein
VANALSWFRPGVLGADAASHRTGETVEVGVPGNAREARVSGPDGRESTWPVTAGVLSYTGTSNAGFHRVEAVQQPPGAGFSQDLAVSLCDAAETDISSRYVAPEPSGGAGADADQEAGIADRTGDSVQREPAWFAFALAGFLLMVAEGLLWVIQRPRGASAIRGSAARGAAP